MIEHKPSKFIIDVSSQAKVLNRSATRFFSYDSHTAEIVIQAEKDGKLIDQTLVDTVDIYFESVNQQYLPTKKLLWNDTMDIGTDGLYSYILPDDFLNYEGLVAFDVYINYKNGDKADSSNRIIFEQRVSAIDRTAGAVELVYIKDMEIAKQDVSQKAKEAMVVMAGYESSLYDYEHQIKDGMDQLYDGVVRVSTDEITKITAELPQVKSVATEEIGKIRDVISTVDRVAQEVSEHADKKIAEYDAKFVSTDQKMAELEQSQGELDAELKVTQQQIADADVYTKAETDVNTAMILDARNLSPAWSWSADGTDRFTTVYPGENLFKKDDVVNLAVGSTIISGPAFRSWYIPVKPGEVYSLQRLEPYSVRFSYVFTSELPAQGISFFAGNFPNIVNYVSNIIVPENANYLFLYLSNAGDGDDTFNIKFEKSSTPTIYTPAPSDDPINAYPIYKGLRLAPSDNPADYDWSYTDEYVDYLKSSSVSKTEFNDLAARLAALENKEV